MIKDIKGKHINLLLLDCGGSFLSKKNVPELRAEVTIEGMNLMNYDGLNIADGELSLGLDFLQKLEQKSRFPFLSANIYQKSNDQCVGQKFAVKEFDGFKVGIIGLVAPDFFDQNFLIAESLVIKDPESTLRKILPEVRSQTELVILLSHLGEKGTRKLVKNTHGIDVAIIGHDSGVINAGELVDRTILVKNSLKGEFLGILALALDRNGSIERFENKVAAISKKIPVDWEVLTLIRKFKEKRAAINRAKLAEKRQREMEKKYREQLKMSPEEFMEKMRKENQLIAPEEMKSRKMEN